MPRGMKRLSDKVAAKMHAEMVTAAEGGPETWYPWYDNNQQTAWLEFPNGEWANSDFTDEIQGYIYAWRMTGVVDQSLPIVKSDRFTAQGLEGKTRVKTALTVALQCWHALPKHRRQVYIENR